jgi:hypothetical protein
MSDSNKSNHISESILIQYLQMGFKLIPLCEDGKIPNVNGLLTSEEQQKSIKESKNGKVEPVNYIYNHPEFWTEDRIKREACRFINVATTYGKTHLKDEDGKDLYLNELDIDDKEIFTRLAIIRTRNGQDHYFLNEIGKETYGVHTRKEWGRRYYWLSHKQEKPIRSNDCKIGYRFEIKTDNSTGHGTLPPSRYRNDATKHYQHIGQNRIVINDRMYGGLLEILKDCVLYKENKRHWSDTNERDIPKSNLKPEFDLNVEDVDEIINEVTDYYRDGFRHNIIYGLAGLLFKRRISQESGELIINKLCDNSDDPEKSDRMVTLYNTYERAVSGQEVAGYSSLLKTFAAIAGENKALETMEYLLGILNKYGNPILNQLKDNVRKELSEHTFEILGYDPLMFVIAHNTKKQILHGKINITNNNDNDNYTATSSSFLASTTISKTTLIQRISYDSVIINAIPIKIIKYEDPTSIETKYEIEFETALNYSFHVEPKSIKDILEILKQKALVYKIRAAEEVLPAILNAYQRDGKVVVKKEVETPGFYFVNGKIYANKIGDIVIPSKEQIRSCANVLSELAKRSRRQEIFATFVTWGIVAPFSYVFKQLDEDGHEKWMPWLYSNGQTNTGKTTCGRIVLSIWGKHKDKKIHDIGFSNADTIPRFGRAVSYDTFPVLINEVTLNDDRQKQLVEALKHSVQSQTARGRLATRSTAEYICALSPCILTGNSPPPDDPAFIRRFIRIYSSTADQHTEEDIKEFNKFFSANINTLKILGDFTIDFILKHQDMIVKDDWKTIGTTILVEFFKSGDIEMPEWIGKFIEDLDMQDIYAEQEQLIRGFFIKKINDTYSRFFNTLAAEDKKMDKTLNLNKLEDRLWFCCDKEQLIPYIRTNKTEDKILILPDIMSDFKASKIIVTNFTDLAEMFQTKPEPTYMNKRTVRLISVSKQKFLEFLLPPIPEQ